MVLSKCESCGKNRKRFRSAFSSWICDNCKKETLDYSHPEAFVKIEARDWWNLLPQEKKIELYLKDKQEKENLKESMRENKNDV